MATEVMVTEATEAMAAAAVCFTGEVRAALCRPATTRSTDQLSPIQSIQKYVLPSLGRHDVFAVIDSVALPADVDQLQHALNPKELETIGEDASERRWSNEIDGTLCLTRNAIGQAVKLGKCWQMILRHEAIRREPYSYVLRLRPDLLFTRKIDFLGRLQQKSTGLCHYAARACFSPCGHNGHADVVVRQPFQKMQQATMISDMVYMARRWAAPPLFDHLNIVLDAARRHMRRLPSRPEERGQQRTPSPLRPSVFIPCGGLWMRYMDACSPAQRESQIHARSQPFAKGLARKSPESMQISAERKWAGTFASPRVCVGNHECLMTAALGLYNGSSGVLRVQHLSAAEVPRLLRLNDTDARDCADARVLYACSEAHGARANVSPPHRTLSHAERRTRVSGGVSDQEGSQVGSQVGADRLEQPTRSISDQNLDGREHIRDRIVEGERHQEQGQVQGHEDDQGRGGDEHDLGQENVQEHANEPAQVHASYPEPSSPGATVSTAARMRADELCAIDERLRAAGRDAGDGGHSRHGNSHGNSNGSSNGIGHVGGSGSDSGSMSGSGDGNGYDSLVVRAHALLPVSAFDLSRPIGEDAALRLAVVREMRTSARVTAMAREAETEGPESVRS